MDGKSEVHASPVGAVMDRTADTAVVRRRRMLFRVMATLSLAALSLPPKCAEAQSGQRALIVVPSRPFLVDGIARPGAEAVQIETAYEYLTGAGYSVTLGSVSGASWTPDQHGLRPNSLFRAILARSGGTIPTNALHSLTPGAFEAILFTGGRSALIEYTETPEPSSFAMKAYTSGSVLGTTGRGAAVLLGMTRPDGIPFLRETRLTAYSDEEEKLDGTDESVPYLLETVLRRAGAIYFKTTAHASDAIVEDRLVTGQNTESTGEVLRAMLEKVRQWREERGKTVKQDTLR
jgi:hypothetical protein